MILIQDILQRYYGVKEVISTAPMGGTSLHPNTLAVVVLDEEPQYWCVKTHINKSSKRLLVELDVQDALRAAGLKVIPEIVPCRDGVPYCVEGLRHFTVQKFVASDTAFYWLDSTAWKSASCAAAGRVLGQLHSYCSRLPKPLVDSVDVLQEHTLSSALHSSFEAALGEPADDAMELVLSKRDIVSKNADLLFAMRPRTTSVLHGDFHAGNVLFTGDDVVGLLDFDYLHQGDHYCDIGYGALMFAGRWGQTDGAFIDNERIAVFVNAYNEGFGASLSTILGAPVGLDQHLAAYMQRAALLVLSWMLETYACFPDTRAQLRVPLLQASFLCQQPVEAASPDVV